MIQTSGFFGPPSTLPESDASGLECLYSAPEGHCMLLKGHRNDRIIVYKILKEEYRNNPVQQRMLRREYEIGASLKHPGICEVLAWVSLPGYGDAIEMEWIDGCRLDEWLAANPGNKLAQKKILLDICDALFGIFPGDVMFGDCLFDNLFSR